MRRELAQKGDRMTRTIIVVVPRQSLPLAERMLLPTGRIAIGADRAYFFYSSPSDVPISPVEEFVDLDGELLAGIFNSTPCRRRKRGHLPTRGSLR